MKTCLVVDDTPFDRKIVELCATKMGLEVTSASSGKEALEICEKALPDCVLLDWEMQEMNGIELLKKLRALEGGGRLPIIICTSHQHASFVGHAYIQGASSYIPKPVTPDRLEEKLRELKVI